MDSSSFHLRFEEGFLQASDRITTLQINVGLVCNLACKHCHVDSSPKRTGVDENMSETTAHRILDWLRANPGIETVDLTGGSPEMNPHFQLLVAECRALNIHVIDRCNPTIISFRDEALGTAYDWIPRFLAEHEVEVVASLPCYLEENVRQQRGMHAYDASIDGLQRLNDMGYGKSEKLRLNLVYNPTGARLPPAQGDLAESYHRELANRFGIVFNELWTITNMPIKRWRDSLKRTGQLEQYMQLLTDAFNPATVKGLMCRHAIHVDSQGRLFDCDFNHALEMPALISSKKHLWDVRLAELARRRISTADHCFGCTAGSGSSCGGALVG